MNDYHVWCEDYGHSEEDADLIRSMDHKMAARVWAEQYEQKNANYPIASGNSVVEVNVHELGGETIRFVVHGWAAPTYSAKAIQ